MDIKKLKQFCRDNLGEPQIISEPFEGDIWEYQENTISETKTVADINWGKQTITYYQNYFGGSFHCAMRIKFTKLEDFLDIAKWTKQPLESTSAVDTFPLPAISTVVSK